MKVCSQTRLNENPEGKKFFFSGRLLFITALLLSFYSNYCFAQTTYSESFEGSFRPAGWSGTIVTGSYDWAQYSGSAHTGNLQAGFDSYDASSGNNATLITPAFSLCASTLAHNVSFWLWRENSYSGADDKIQVYINSSASLAGATLIGTAHRYSGTAPTSGNNTWSQFTFALPGSAATNYIIFKAVSAFGNSLYLDDVSWVTDPCAAGVANDYCSGAITVACPSTTAGTTAAATTTGDPTSYCGATPVAAGVFYKFVGTGKYVTASLCGSSYNTLINVFSGSCAGLGCIDGNDDACLTSSSISFATGVGINYYIFVSGPTAADKGAFTLTISCSTPLVANDDCDNAISITPTATCSAPVAGNTTNATANIAGCVGNADDDIWYSFVATGTSHQVVVTPVAATFDPVVELFSGACTSLTSLGCQNANGANGTETLNASGLTIGTTYYLRVYHYAAGAGGGTFNICVINPPAGPANDDCSGATNLTENVGCVTTAGTTANATSSGGACSGNGNQDVWYKFTATNSTATITVDPTTAMDPVVQLYSGTCASLTSLNCVDVTSTSSNEVVNAVGLAAGTVYYIQVSDYLATSQTFNICVSGPAASATPTNDNPCNAIALPSVTPACNFLEFTTSGATQTSNALAPTPTGCTHPSGSTNTGGWPGHDVWFSVVIPSTGQITITPEPNAGISDAAMALYSGACGSLVQVACSDDNDFPGNANDLKPFINKSGLTVGATYYIRYWAFSTANDGAFGLCVQTTSNDACSNALKICNLDGYSSSTSEAYTADHPGSGATQMAGDCEYISGGVWTSSAGTNSGYPFGQVDPWGDANVPSTEGVSVFDVSIENNSWVSFVAGNSKVSLTVTINQCFKSPAGGIQMQIFSTTGSCSGFVPASPFYESATSFTVTANNLTVGTTYLLMIDGYAGDVCNYSINAGTGVQFPAITATSNPVCLGNSTTLTAPSATTYSWTLNGATTQSITVTPPVNTTYTCVVTGSCGTKQTLTALVNVSSGCAPLPIELLTFDAFYKGGESAYLIWETATETNNSTFSVERSTDGQNYSLVGTVDSKAPGGNSSSPLRYRMTDPSVRTGTYYYRLKQTDLNGDFTYSGVATLKVEDGSTEFGVKPNPTTSQAELTYLAFEDAPVLLKIYDYSGRVVTSNELFGIKGLNTTSINLGDQPAGIYLVTLSANGKVYKTKLVRKYE